jgi:uncharacterized protein YndB with AHSA1/START domain
MTRFANSVTISGPVERVFDLATTAGLWPRWHPATTGVSGVTDRPYRLGDLIHEDIEVAGLTARITWRVTEHDRPHRVALQRDTPLARITYTFGQYGGVTTFRREVEYEASALADRFPDPAELERLLSTQSEVALRQFKALAEATLRQEGPGAG